MTNGERVLCAKSVIPAMRILGCGFICLAAFILLCALTPSLQAQADNSLFLQLLSKGTREAEQGNVAAAEADLHAAIALEPTQANGWYELGSVLGQAADFVGAEAAFRRALQLQPALAKAHYSLALTLIANPQNKQDWPEAITECKAALQYQPAYPQAFNLLGAGLAKTGQNEAAIAALRQAVKLEPSFAEAHFNLALALESAGQSEAALAEYKEALNANHAYPEAASAFGKLLLRVGKVQEAQIQLLSAIHLNPDLLDAHYTFARLLRLQGNGEGATLEFAVAQQLEQRVPDGIQSAQLSNQALQIASKGDLVGAAALLRKAIALKPDYGVPHYNLGLILADSNDMAGATRELTEAASLLPGQYKIWYDLGRVFLLTKDTSRAAVALKWAARLAPSDSQILDAIASLPAGEAASIETPAQPPFGIPVDTATAHFSFAMQWQAENELNEEVAELLRSLFLQPDQRAARESLADAYKQLKETDLSMLEYQKLILAFPDDADSHLNLGQLMLARRERKEAKTQFEQALKARPGWSEAITALSQINRATN